MPQLTVLFVCVHNSARSQMAEAFLKQMGGEEFKVVSAGLEPGPLNPLAVEVMAEEGMDISGNTSKSVFDLYKAGKLFNYVITVCDESSEKQCPLFPGITQRLHWGFPDPASFAGSQEEKLEQTRKVRDAIKGRLAQWLDELKAKRD